MANCLTCIHQEVCKERMEIFNLPNIACQYEAHELSGEWIKFTLEGGFLSSHKCSNCGFCGNQLWHFCPNCGADMRGKNELNRVSKELNSEIEKLKSEIVPDYRDGWRLKDR